MRKKEEKEEGQSKDIRKDFGKMKTILNFSDSFSLSFISSFKFRS